MKFVCEKCKTKYSIADEKVRRKVLKIRCKNCEHIIVVRDPSRKDATGEAGPAAPSSPLDRALDGAFSNIGATAPVAGRGAPVAGRGAPVAARGGALAATARLEPAPAHVPQPASDDDERTLIQSPIERVRTPVPPPPEKGDDEWYLSVDGHQFGPMAFDELARRIKRGEARGDEAYVWCDGFDDWLPASKVPELRPYMPPPPPPGKSGLFQTPNLDFPAEVGAVPPLPPPSTIPSPLRPPPTPPTPPIPRGAPTAPSGVPAHIPVAPQPAPSLAPAQPELMSPAMDGLRHLPAQFATEMPQSQLPPALVPVGAGQGRTQAWIKLAAISGILTMLIGIAILVYVIFFDGPRPAHHGPMAQHGVGQLGALKAPTGESSDAGTSRVVSMKFAPDDIERTRERRVAGGAGKNPRHSGGDNPSGTAAAQAPADKHPGMSERDRRLLAAMQGDVGGPGPKVAATRRRRTRPVRNFNIREVDNLRRSSAFALKACYQRAAKRDNSLKAVKAVIKLAIAPSGLTHRVGVSGVSDYGLRTCLIKTVRRWSFKTIGGSDDTDVEFSLEFRGN